MIGSISSTALMGLQKNLDYFDTAAARVVKNTASFSSSTETSSVDSTSATGNLSSVLQESSPSLEEDMVDLLLAKRFVQGQVGVIQTEDEMLAEVIQMGRRRTE